MVILASNNVKITVAELDDKKEAYSHFCDANENHRRVDT